MVYLRRFVRGECLKGGWISTGRWCFILENSLGISLELEGSSKAYMSRVIRQQGDIKKIKYTAINSFHFNWSLKVKAINLKHLRSSYNGSIVEITRVYFISMSNCTYKIYQNYAHNVNLFRELYNLNSLLSYSSLCTQNKYRIVLNYFF